MSYVMGYSDVKPWIWRGQDWILSQKILLTLLGVSALMFFIGIVFLAVGFDGVGGVLLGLGGCGFMVLLLLALHAYCCRYTREAATQTGQMGTMDVDVVPTYAVIHKPSSLKRSDSGSKRNGTTLEKHVTLSPDTEARERFGQITVAPSAGTADTETAYQIPVQHGSRPQIYSQPNSYGQTQIYNQPNSYGHSQIYSQPNTSSYGHSQMHTMPDSYGHSQIYKTAGQTYAPPQSSSQSYASLQSSSQSCASPQSSSQSYAPPQSIYRPQSPSYAPPPTQYPVQVYPMRTASSTSSSIRYGFDDDYDNPAETTPILSNQSASSASSYQFRSSTSQQAYVSKEIGGGGGGGGGVSGGSGDGGCGGDGGGTRDPCPDLPEPQGLVYPSAKRPMTFEQTSSSKMSVYDNVSSQHAADNDL